MALAALALVLPLAGCEYFVSDVATRIRYALIDASRALEQGQETMTLSLHPDHWPDSCRKRAGYKLVLSPYRGGKQVAVGDINVFCVGGGGYYTGLGSERIYLAREMSIDKKSEDELRISLRKTGTGFEIVGLE